MGDKVWDTSADGTIEYIQLSKSTLPGAMEVMEKSFFTEEKVCIALGLAEDPGAIKELCELALRAANDGLSLVAVDKRTGKVAGASFNKVQVKSGDDASYFAKFASDCKHESSKALVEYMLTADGQIDIFQLSNSTCLLELMFVAVLPEYRGKRIASALFALSFELVRSLKGGVNVKRSLDGAEMPIEPVPTTVSAICTSLYTQRISEKLGFVVGNTSSYEKLEFRGETFASKIGPETPNYTVVYKSI